MSWRASVVLLGVVTLIVAGCGAKVASEPGNPGHKASDPFHQIANLGGGVRVGYLAYEGGKVKCIKWDDYRKGGLTCDFEEFHQQHGYHPDYYANHPTDAASFGG